MTAVEGSLCPVCDHKSHNPCGFAGAKTERHGSLSVPIKTALCRIAKRIYRISRYIRFLLLQPVCRLLPLVQRVGFLDTLSGAAGAAPGFIAGRRPGSRRTPPTSAFRPAPCRWRPPRRRSGGCRPRRRSLSSAPPCGCRGSARSRGACRASRPARSAPGCRFSRRPAGPAAPAAGCLHSTPAGVVREVPFGT